MATKTKLTAEEILAAKPTPEQIARARAVQARLRHTRTDTYASDELIAERRRAAALE